MKLNTRKDIEDYVLNNTTDRVKELYISNKDIKGAGQKLVNIAWNDSTENPHNKVYSHSELAAINVLGYLLARKSKTARLYINDI